MKLIKQLSLALAILLVAGLSLTALAAPATPLSTLPYRHPRLDFELDYPADWYPLDKDGAAEVLEKIQAGETDVPETARQVLESAMPQIEQMDIVLFVSPNEKGHNLNVVAGPFGSTPTFEEVMGGLPQALRQQYTPMYPGIAFEPESAAKLGELDALKFPYSYSAGGLTYQQTQYYLFHNDTQYVITFTWVSPSEEELPQLEATMEAVVASFEAP